jgi:Tfp pilus tip-associated adhesin PilY1
MIDLDDSVLATQTSFLDNGNACKGFSEVLEKYNDYATKLSFSGPTSFEPIISKAIEIVKSRKSFPVRNPTILEDNYLLPTILDSKGHNSMNVDVIHQYIPML